MGNGGGTSRTRQVLKVTGKVVGYTALGIAAAAVMLIGAGVVAAAVGQGDSDPMS